MTEKRTDGSTGKLIDWHTDNMIKKKKWFSDEMNNQSVERHTIFGNEQVTNQMTIKLFIYRLTTLTVY